MTNLPTSKTPSPSLWIDIDTSGLAANVRAVRKSIATGAAAPKIMAVVKADGYGHGAVIAARAFLAGGADALAVTTFDEALQLVDAGLVGHVTDVPLLVFAPPTDSSQAEFGVNHGLTLTACAAFDVDLAMAAAMKVGRIAQVHLKTDTGMGRFGGPPSEAAGIARKIAAAPNARLTGVYTHFAQATSPNLSATRRALGKFTAFCDTLAAAGIGPGTRHCANSASALRLPESRLDMVRLGTVLYGQYPSGSVPRVEGLVRETWSLRGRVVFVHDISAGSTVGYGAEYRAPSTRRVAVVPVGFADGFATAPTSVYAGVRGLKTVIGQILGQLKPTITFGGNHAPILGRVAMQTIVVDVTDMPEVGVGSVADIPARRLAARSSIPRIVKI